MRIFIALTIIFGLIGLISSPAALAEVESGVAVPSYRTSGLPVPRYVSLRSDKVFVRSGPALRYPIKWIYQKEGLPVEVIQEFDTWRKVRDAEGEEGWIHQSLLSGQRTVLIDADATIPLYKDNRRPDKLVAKLEPKVIASLEKCTEDYCELEAEGFHGWAERKSLWGIYDREELN